MLSKYFTTRILKTVNAIGIDEIDVIQELWSGYGKILRIYLKESDLNSVIVKLVRLPKKESKQRGSQSDFSHQRKIKSYRIETAWYSKWSDKCTEACRVPRCLALDKQGDEVLIVLEDLNESGYEYRKTSVTWNEMKVCISWLAHFHAVYMNENPENLWKTGTYWHLATRPDELKVLKDSELKQVASKIDQILKNAPYQTFVHGDAKLANFCFTKDGTGVAAVDFQYIGGGCGMKDLAYFTGSCLSEEESETYESQVLDYYFNELKTAIKTYHKDVDFSGLESIWRPLYHYAWADFHRFYKGWSPGYFSEDCYSERVTRKVVHEIKTL